MTRPEEAAEPAERVLLVESRADRTALATLGQGLPECSAPAS
ncbi:hypothetical protein ACFWHW_18335 [Streptomyces pharetrae]